MSRLLLIGATLLLGAASPVVAQAPIDFAAGRPVRVQFPSEEQPIEGSLVSADRESFVFRPTGADFESSAYRSTVGGQVAEVKYEEVDVLWVDLGRSRKHSAWRGALWGGYLGAASGAVAGLVAIDAAPDAALARTAGEVAQRPLDSVPERAFVYRAIGRMSRLSEPVGRGSADPIRRSPTRSWCGLDSAPRGR